MLSNYTIMLTESKKSFRMQGYPGVLLFLFWRPVAKFPAHTHTHTHHVDDNLNRKYISLFAVSVVPIGIHTNSRLNVLYILEFCGNGIVFKMQFKYFYDKWFPTLCLSFTFTLFCVFEIWRLFTSLSIFFSLINEKWAHEQYYNSEMFIINCRKCKRKWKTANNFPPNLKKKSVFFC